MDYYTSAESLPPAVVAWFVDIFAKMFFAIGFLVQKIALLKAERRLEEEEVQNATMQAQENGG